MARLALAAIVATGLALPTTASGVTLHASSAPSAIQGAPPWKATYTLELDAAPSDERIVVSASGQLDQVAGAGTLVTDMQGVGDIFPAPGCAPLPSWKFETYFHSIVLDLPAGTATFLTMSRTRSTFPAGGDDLAYRFEVRSLAPDGSASDPLVASLAGPAIMLPRRPELKLRSRDVPRFGALVEHKPLRIAGRTDSRLAGQHVELLYATGTSWVGKRKPIARVRVRGDGSFRYRWSVPRSGHYIVGARYRSQDERFASTVSQCGVGFGYAS